MPVLTLGGIEFKDFEVPEEIVLGGAHSGKLWKLPGGVRILDSQGPDDDCIRWSGRFRYQGALQRATAIDAMRRAGQAVPLSVLGLAYSVYIKRFSFRPHRPFEIPYDIECDVLEDQTHGIANAIAIGISALVGNDITAGFAAIGSVSSAVTTAANAFQSAIGAVPSLSTASQSELIQVAVAGRNLTNSISTQAAAEDARIVANPLAGDDLGIASIGSTLTAMNNEVAILQGQGYFGRASANISNSKG